jgi:uncharacterized protein YbjT (DUF2867 family)
MSMRRALVTGATGYIGGRLVPRLLEAGFTVRVLVRDADKLKDVPWRSQVDIVEGDLLDAAAVNTACKDIDVLYYLVHAMGQKGDFEAKELTGARYVAQSAKANKLSRIVYLGGLHPATGELSKHLRSRAALK